VAHRQRHRLTRIFFTLSMNPSLARVISELQAWRQRGFGVRDEGLGIGDSAFGIQGLAEAKGSTIPNWGKNDT